MRNIIISLILSASLLTSAQNVEALNDSIKKYTFNNPNKALKFGFDAIAISDYNKLDWALYETNYRIGQTLFYLARYKDSYDYLLQAINIFEALPKSERKFPNISKPPWILVTIGNVYYKNNLLDKASKFYSEALDNFYQYPDSEKQDQLFGINTAEVNLALVNVKLGKFDDALKFYNKVLARRLSMKTSAEILFTYALFMNLYCEKDEENKAALYFKKVEDYYNLESPKIKNDKFLNRQYVLAVRDYCKYLINKENFNLALKLLVKVKELSKSFQHDLPSINILIAKSYFEIKDFQKVKVLLNENLNSPFVNYEERIKTLELMSSVYSLQSDTKNLLSVKDSLIYYKGFSQIVPYNQLDNIENVILLSEKQQEVNENKLRLNRTIFIFSTVLIILFFILVIYRINAKLQKERSTILELEKSQIEEELSVKKRELFSKTNYILQRNESLTNLKVKFFNKNIPVNTNKIKREISNLINSENAYIEFDKKFVEVFPDFYKKINQNYSLSKTDFRLIAYIKMNKSNNEIAQISGISLRTVQSQRYRLAKKLNLTKHQKLDSFIFSI